MLRFNKEAFLKLSTLITPYVHESMRYKTEILTKTCPVCGTVFTMTQSGWCSQECAEVGQKQHKREYWRRIKSTSGKKRGNGKKAHREEIKCQSP